MYAVAQIGNFNRANRSATMKAGLRVVPIVVVYPPINRVMDSMDSGKTTLYEYKLDSVFYEDGNTVVHARDAQLGLPAIATWRTEGKLGSGAFGVVWRQREEGSGQLRAVKTVSKQQLNVRELEALVELQDVSLHQ